MSKVLRIIFVFLVTSVSLHSETLTREEQTEIIRNFGIVTGQLPDPVAAAAIAGNRPPDKCGTNATVVFALNRDKLDPNLMKSLGVRATTRPVLPLTYGSANGYFLIHYATTGSDAVYQPLIMTLEDTVPDYVVMVARIADSVYTHHITQLGYPVPPSDTAGSADSDPRTDIYLHNLPSAYYGLTDAETSLPPLRATAYIELDNDYGDLPKYVNRPLDAARVTIAHEFFHVIQFGIDVTEAENYQFSSRRQYWMEMSAVWMEEETYDDINDYYDYLPYFFNYPVISLQDFSGDLHEYASVVFPLFLVQRYGSKDIIKDIWLRCADLGTGPSFLLACDAAVHAADSTNPDASLASAMSEFGVWNYFTGPYASMAPKGAGYEERANYPVIPRDQFVAVSRYPRYQNITQGYPQYNGTGYWTFENLSSRTNCSLLDSSGGALPIPCDSVMAVLALFNSNFVTPTPTVWAISVIYELSLPSDSFEVNSFQVPSYTDDSTRLIEIDAYHPERFRSISVSISPTSNNYLFYSTTGIPGPNLGFAISDSGILNSQLLTPYPNPAVVSSMLGNPLTFRLQYKADNPNSNSVSNPLLAIDIFSVAGDFVRSISAGFGSSERLNIQTGGLYEASWDMKNGSGKDVASGAYFALARLWEVTSNKKILLTESKTKVAVIR